MIGNNCGQQNPIGQLADHVTAGSPGMQDLGGFKHGFNPIPSQHQMAHAHVPQLNFSAPINGANMADEFAHQHNNVRMQHAQHAHHRQQQHMRAAPMSQQQRPPPMMQQQFPMMRPMHMMQRPVMMQPQQVQPHIPQESINKKDPARVVDEIETVQHSEIDDIRVTESDKEKIRRIIENPDEKWQKSNFVNLLKEFEQKPSAAEIIQPERNLSSDIDYEEAQGSHWANNFIEQLRQEDPEWASQLERIRSQGVQFDQQLGVDWNSYEQNLLGNRPLDPIPTSRAEDEYAFAENNEYMDGPSAFEEGLRLMNEGNLTEAVKAFEAACRQEPTRAEAWRYLGVCNAHNENEQAAIAAFLNCVKYDAYDLEALLQLGVSYTNDLNSRGALNYLKTWLSNHPDYSSISIGSEKQQMNDFYGSSRDSEQEAINLFNQAVVLNPEDPETHTVLGVLYNLTCEYDKAAFHFKHAVRLKPDDATLWNKLGATQANGDHSKEALESYRQALQLKPNYTRALSNLGISFSNLFMPKEAAQSYLACLSFNPDADNVWSHLAMALGDLERNDLIPLCEQKNIDLFRPHFDF